MGRKKEGRRGRKERRRGGNTHTYTHAGLFLSPVAPCFPPASPVRNALALG